MTRFRKSLLAMVMLASTFAAADTIILSPNTIQGTIQFANTNPAVLSAIQGLTLRSYSVTFGSTAPQGYSSGSSAFLGAGAMNSAYSVSAESDGNAGAVTYSATASFVYGRGNGGTFLFPTESVTLHPAASQPAGATLDFAALATVHHIRFGTDNTCNTPVTINTGSISGSPLGNPGNDQFLFNINYTDYLTPNWTSAGPNLPQNTATLNVRTGTDSFADTINLQFPIDLSAAGDVVIDHCIVIPTGNSQGLLGAIVSPISVAGHAAGNNTINAAKALGPVGNFRDANLAAGQPVSFPNLVPGNWTARLDLRLDQGGIESEMFTAQDWSLTTPIAVTAGQTTDGTQIIGGIARQPFVMDPAAFQGTIRLYDAYATDHPGAQSTLSSLLFAEDYSMNGASVRGASSATSITQSSADAASARAETSFGGRYNAATGELLSTYNLPLPMLYDKPGLWAGAPNLSLQFSSSAIAHYSGDYLSAYSSGRPSDSPDPAAFRLGSLYIQPYTIPNAVLSPGQVTTSDQHFCFNEIVVEIQSSTGKFVSPKIQASGGYAGTDFEGNPVAYNSGGFFYGAPYAGSLSGSALLLASRAATGSVAFTLPQGTNWTLTPAATFVADDGTTSTGDFTPITLPSLGCGQRVTLVPGLTISLDAPAACVAPSAGADIITLSGTINSNGAAVDRVWYTVGSGPEMDICNTNPGNLCGATFSVPVTLGQGDNTIAVYGSSGFVSGTPQVSETITCGANGCGSNCTSVGPSCTPSAYSPGENEYGLVAFEDRWPDDGDLDFNDQNVAYNYAFILDGDSKVVGFNATFDMLSIGATIDNGLYLHLPMSIGSAGTAYLTIGSGNPLQLTPLATLGDAQQLTDAVYQLASSTRSLFGNNAGFIDTQSGQPVRSSTPLTLQVRFGAALPQGVGGLDLGAAPFDIFIAQVAARNHQVHLASYSGAQTGAAASLFHTGSDASNLDVTASGGANNTGRYYVNHNGLPFGLAIPQLVDWTVEGTPIEQLFTEINTFAASGGQSAKSFYKEAVDTDASWQHTVSGPLPVPPTPAAPGAPEFTGVVLCPQ